MSSLTAAEPRFPAVIDLSELDGEYGFVLEGIDQRDYAGRAVHGAVDVNGDGVDDILIGAHKAETGRGIASGEVYVVFGRPDIGTDGKFELASLDGQNGFILSGYGDESFTGTSVGSGDFNGDGWSDIFIGASNREPNGTAYVVFGRPNLGEEGRITLAGLDGKEGFVINGIDSEDAAGIVVGAADVNGDGIDDMIVTAPAADVRGKTDAGEAYVVFGKQEPFAPVFSLASLLPAQGGDGTEGCVFQGANAYDTVGTAGGAAGDINADGIEDFIIGTSFADPAGKDRAGESFVIFGNANLCPGGVVQLLSLNGNGFAIEGVDPVDFSGRSVSTSGDVNSDGIDDFMIGADGADPDGLEMAGESYVIFGHEAIGSEGIFDLLSLDGSNGFIVGGQEAFDRLGMAVSGAGDINEDGTEDFVLGATGAAPNGEVEAGRAYVVFGGVSIGIGGRLDLTLLDGSNGFVLNGVEQLDQTGLAVAEAGDVNGDGVDDVIIGSLANPDGVLDAGAAYVIFGRVADGDEDGIPDGSDNCTLLPNADQRDTNGDGFGNVCDPDLDDNGIVNFMDLGVLKRVFLTRDPHADFDGNGVVDFQDLATMKAFFLKPPGPSGLAQ
jgi:hypothetical protein